jgi:hypothetical protein
MKRRFDLLGFMAGYHDNLEQVKRRVAGPGCNNRGVDDPSDERLAVPVNEEFVLRAKATG